MKMLWLAVILMACGSAADPKGSGLPEPWKQMNLPVGAGEVQMSSSTELHVTYVDVGLNRSGAATKWAAALERSGWVEQEIRAMGPVIGVTYKRSNQDLEMIVAGQGTQVDVQLETTGGK